MKRLIVDVRPGEYAVTRLGADAPVPAGLLDLTDVLVSVTRTPAELSIIAPASFAVDGDTAEKGWRLLTVRGPLEFTLTGIMAALAGELAAAGVSLFALSTYDTDHLLVKHTDLERAVLALRAAGHELVVAPEA
ncbi:ACT domain-containing protein [Lentzea sp. BCCO 10_0061]|uniref:ACT domain-containing protein n=1 Tax=Lentzea sokolovensis TaxID=3095429 RepID=A0ABU4V1Y7_9PSEU|nr:ACT domain-containing protein [Lentzea sp. BCCO 10_0061]MDX8145264.1 ACT domain-containing protein [Lentzea sp. BCCO 10_0061]